MPRKPQSRPKLTLLEELLVLGGRYMFGRGATFSGKPVLYISTAPGRPGLTILAQNVRAFQRSLADAVDKFGPEVDGEGTMRAAEASENSSNSRCPSQTDEHWQEMTAASGNEGDVLMRMLTPHEFEAGINTVTGAPFTTCEICGYDTTKVEEYAAWGKQAKGSKRKPRRA